MTTTPPRRGPKSLGYHGSWYIVVEVASRKGRINHYQHTHKAECIYCHSVRWYEIDHLDKCQSCGCRMMENRKKTRELRGTGHGDCTRTYKAPEYQAWCNFKAKCKKYNIPYHKPWSSYKQWLQDVGRRPHPNYCFSRISELEPYTPANSRWLPRYQLPSAQPPKPPPEYVGPPHDNTNKYLIQRQGKANPIKG